MSARKQRLIRLSETKHDPHKPTPNKHLPAKRSFSKVVEESDIESASSDSSVEEVYEGKFQFQEKKRIKVDENPQVNSKQIGAEQVSPGPNKNLDLKLQKKQEQEEILCLQSTQITTSPSNSTQQSPFTSKKNSPSVDLISSQEYREEKKQFCDDKKQYNTAPLKKQQNGKTKPAMKDNVNFLPYIQQMIFDNKESEEKEDGKNISIFKKREVLDIQNLQTRSPQIEKNKLSDKFNRRDYSFYQLYCQRQPVEEMVKLKENQFPWEIGVQQELYGDIEIDDYLNLLNDDMIIEKKFGETIKVELIVNQKDNQIQRKVTEYQDKVKLDDEANKEQLEEILIEQDSEAQLAPQEDQDLMGLDLLFKSLEKEFGKTKEQLSDIFVTVSGRLNKMRDYLLGKPVIEWNYLEDLALTKNEESQEYRVLMMTKGWDEIKTRREFLLATPEIMQNNELKQQQMLQEL